jgi:glycosyltransferase involved in cell wall biosynthesis
MSNIRIIYPYPMHLSNGYTYMLSISQFLNSLAEMAKVDLLCLDSKEQFTNYLQDKLDLKLHPNLNIVQIKNKKFGIKSNKLFFKSSVAKYLKSLSDNENKIIYTRDFKQMIFALKLKNTLQNTKFIFEAHQILSQNLCKQGKYKNAKKIRELENKIFNSVDSLICITKTLSNEIKKNFKNSVKKHFILPVGFSRKFLEIKSREKIYDIVYTGSFVGWKGVDDLIDAIKIIKEKRNISAVVIGANDKECKKYNKIITDYGLDNSIRLIKKINHKNVISYLAKSSVGVLPNNYDDDSMLFTSPLKLYEYFGAGLKVVCSRLPAIESAIDNKLVYWSISENPNSLAEQIINALDDVEFDDGNSRKYAQNFTWGMRAKNFINNAQSLF